MLKLRLCILVIISLLFVPAVWAQLVPRQLASEAAKQQAGRAGITPLAGCTPIPISIPTTRSGFLTTSSCYDSVINAYEDIYTFNGTAGQTITVDYSSTSYEVFLWFEGLVLYSDGTIQSTHLSSGVSRSRFTYTLTQTRAYTLETESLYGPGEGQPDTGAYNLVITTTGGGGGNCTANSTTLCLNNNRFAVSASWRTGSQTGVGTAVPITSDTGYFTFFSATNVEVVIKVLDACGLNSRYWVFAGGLTDVNVTLTVRDTKSGTTRTYTNPLGVAFQPIQDTNALAVCP
jgi:hypothetical protein